MPTVTDILRELEKPGRDPRPAFKTATFQDDVEKIQDLKPGMILEGAVTNVAAFGAFVDIGVHQDGLIHISHLSKKFVKDAREVTKPGEIVRVKVLSIDVPRRRIALTLRLDDPIEAEGGEQRVPSQVSSAGKARMTTQPQQRSKETAPRSPGALGEALLRAGMTDKVPPRR